MKEIKQIKIGNQIWSSENLALTVDRDGNELELGKDYFYPNGDKNNVEEYGLLYTWNAAMKIVPEGWHLPSKEEWEKLRIRVHDSAKALAANSGWCEYPDLFTVGHRQKTNNISGFSAKPAGYYSALCHSCLGFSFHAFFWTTEEWDDINRGDSAIFGVINYNQDFISRDFEFKTTGCSVRCIKNK